MLKRLAVEVNGAADDEEAAGWDEGAEGKENVGLGASEADVDAGVEKSGGAVVPVEVGADVCDPRF